MASARPSGGSSEMLKKEARGPLGRGGKGPGAVTIIVTDDYLQGIAFRGMEGTVRRTFTIAFVSREEAPTDQGGPVRVREEVEMNPCSDPPEYARVDVEGFVIQLTALNFALGEGRLPALNAAQAFGESLRRILGECGMVRYELSQLIISIGANELELPAPRGDWGMMGLDRRAYDANVGISTVVVELSRSLSFPPTTYLGARIVLGLSESRRDHEISRETMKAIRRIPLKVFQYLGRNSARNPWGLLEGDDMKGFQVFDIFGQFSWNSTAGSTPVLLMEGCQEFAALFRLCWARGTTGRAI